MRTHWALPGLFLLPLACSESTLPRAPAMPRSKVAASARSVAAGIPYRSIARVPAGTNGPLGVTVGGHRLAVWSEPEGAGRVWKSQVVGAQGSQQSTQSLATVETDLGVVGLGLLARRNQAWLGWSSSTNEGSERLYGMLLNAKGEALSKPVSLGSPAEAIVWTGVADSAGGPMVFWASSEGNTATLRTAGFDPTGKLRFAARAVASEIQSWQLVETPKGAALALVHRVAGHAGGTTEVVFVDGDTGQDTARVVVQPQPSAEGDIDIVRVGANLVLAYTDRVGYDSRVVAAAVDLNGRLVKIPAPITPPLGEQALYRLIAPPDGSAATIVWQDLSAPSAERLLTLGRVDAQGHLGAERASFTCPADTVLLPEVLATQDGVAVLTLDQSPAEAEASDDDGEVAEPPMAPEPSASLRVPTLLRFDGQLALTQVVALRLGGEKPAVPVLSWGLDCTHHCRAFAALDDLPSPIVDVELTGLKPELSSADAADSDTLDRLVVPRPEPGEPRIAELVTVGSMPSVADLAMAQTGSRLLLSYVTEFDPSTPLVPLSHPAPDGRRDPLQATVAVNLWDGGQPLVPNPPAVSLRARSMGGVSLALAPSGADAVVGWTALDAGQPQVFVTRLDAQGKKLGQRMLTRKKGELGEVAVTATADGWIAAWVDSRTGSPEIYVSALTPALVRRGDERRLTTLPGNPTDLAFVASEGHLALVWTDTRDAARPGRGGVYARSLNPSTAEPIGAEWTIVKSSRSAYGLVSSPIPGGAVLAWIEGDGTASAAESATEIRAARVDGKGRLAWGPETVVVPRGIEAGVGIECRATTCLGAATTDEQGEGFLEVFTFDPRTDTLSFATRLVRGLGVAARMASPVVVGNQVYVTDHADHGEVRLRRVSVGFRD